MFVCEGKLQIGWCWWVCFPNAHSQFSIISYFKSRMLTLPESTVIQRLLCGKSPRDLVNPGLGLFSFQNFPCSVKIATLQVFTKLEEAVKETRRSSCTYFTPLSDTNFCSFGDITCLSKQVKPLLGRNSTQLEASLRLLSLFSPNKRSSRC